MSVRERCRLLTSVMTPCEPLQAGVMPDGCGRRFAAPVAPSCSSGRAASRGHRARALAAPGDVPRGRIERERPGSVASASSHTVTCSCTRAGTTRERTAAMRRSSVRGAEDYDERGERVVEGIRGNLRVLAAEATAGDGAPRRWPWTRPRSGATPATSPRPRAPRGRSPSPESPNAPSLPAEIYTTTGT